MDIVMRPQLQEPYMNSEGEYIAGDDMLVTRDATKFSSADMEATQDPRGTASV